jgi:hypothetical protein
VAPRLSGAAGWYELPALSVTEMMVEVALFQPMATMLVFPAVCALVYATGTLA